MLDIDKNTVDFLVSKNMVKEVENLFKVEFPKLDILLEIALKRKVDRVYFVACGSPLCACQTAQLLFQRYSDIPCQSFSGWDFVDFTPAKLDEKTLVIAISHYGKTEEVANSLLIAGKAGALTVAFTRDETGNPVSEAAAHVIAYGGECIWEIHLLLAYYLVCRLIEAFSPNPQVKAILKDMAKIPSILAKLAATVEDKSKELGIKASQWPFIYTVASGPLLPLAYKEGVISLMEFTWTHGCALNSAEFRHGPLEIVQKGVPFIFLLGSDETRHTTERALNFVKKLTENIIVFDFYDYGIDLHPMLVPMVLFVPLDYFYYYLAIAKDHNPDDRRYYGGLMPY